MTKPGRRNALPRNVAASDTVFEVAVPDTSTADAAGVPAYFPWMAYGVGVLTYFIYIFINVFTFFVIYYIYGSIEAKEKDKKNSITN